MSLRNPLPGRDKASKRVNTLTEKRLNAAYGTHRFGGRLSEAALPELAAKRKRPPGR